MANELTNAQFNFQQAQVLQNQQQQMQQNQPGQQQQIQQSQSGQQNQSNQGSQQMFGFNMMSQQNHSHPYHQQNNIIFDSIGGDPYKQINQLLKTCGEEANAN